MNKRPPVENWATDFDHLDPRWIEDPFPIWEELRSRCPIAHTERYRGVYLPTRYEDVRAIAYDTTHFSSHKLVVREGGTVGGGSPPITTDPPKHRGAKTLLLPAFTPDAIERHRARTREICRTLVDGLVGRKRCDAAIDYAQEIPVRVIAHMLGIPSEDGDQFRTWIHEILEVGITDDLVLMRATEQMRAYFLEIAERRRLDPRDDLISYLLAARINGKPLSDNHFFGSLRLLLVAGIDTTWSAIGASLWHLATHDEDRRRLAREPRLLGTAVEELLRAYAPVTMAREIVEDAEIGGTTFRKNEMVLLAFPAANRDPDMFENADRVVIDRTENRHVAFGVGIHRCIGSNLARMEINVALSEWLTRIPEFRLDPAGKTLWSRGTVRGPRQLPVIIDG
jgi:cytochrome P450